MASLLGMPFAMINLGCEMIYILHQRLHAQGIPPDKGLKVLQEIVGTMFEPAFLADKLFVPQDMYSLQSTRKLFVKIVHSSIMKLSANSMDKLFDLMVMGVKYCLMCSTTLEDMLQVTLRHLRTVQALLSAAMAAQPQAEGATAAGAEAVSLLRHAEEASLRFYGSLSTGELALLRVTLARFFQDKRVRVSLFLAEGIQLQSGKLVMPSCISDSVGLVRSFGPAGQLVGEERLQLGSQQVAVQEFFCHPVPLGDNLYSKDRPRVVPPARAADGGGAAEQQQEGSSSGAALAPAGTATTAAAAAAPEPNCDDQAATKGAQFGRYAHEQDPSSKAAAQELDFLAALVGASGRQQPAVADNFKLNLCFEDECELLQPQQHNASVPARGQPGSQATLPHQLQFGTGGRNEAYVQAVRLDDVLEAVQLDAGGGGDDAEDLLDLMDKASSSQQG